MKLIEQLLGSIARAYPSDAMKPGLVLAQLDDGFYASVRRYPSASSSHVVVKARAKDFGGAVNALALAWVVETGRTGEFRKAWGLSQAQLASFLSSVLGAA